MNTKPDVMAIHLQPNNDKITTFDSKRMKRTVFDLIRKSREKWLY